MFSLSSISPKREAIVDQLNHNMNFFADLEDLLFKYKNTMSPSLFNTIEKEFQVILKDNVKLLNELDE